MEDNVLVAHLDQMELRLRTDIAEVRSDFKKVAADTAELTPRVDAVERQTRWIWGSAGSGFLTMLGVFVSHLWGSHGR